MKSSLQHTRTDNEQETVLSLHGVLDATSVASTRLLLDRLVGERRPRVVLELSSLRLIDSTGVGAIVSAFKRLRAQAAQLVLVGARGQPLAMLRLLRLERVLFSEVETNEPQAAASASPRQRATMEAQALVSGS